MKEYIEREATIKRFTFPTLEYLGLGPQILASKVVKAIEAIPAANVVEVRHEKWTPAYYGHVNYVRCTGCGSYFEDSIFAHEDSVEYCPHCGAKMDGGVEEEE